MARYTGPVCRLCRREGLQLFLKGERCYTDKCPIKKRFSPPGEHTQSRRKASDYAVHLREKQKARRWYGVLEGQFRRYFDRAASSRGATGSRLLELLERRLDNVVFRLNFAAARTEARQLVRHGHYTVNGHKVDIPSYQVRPGDVISVAPKSRSLPRFREIIELAQQRPVTAWLESDAPNFTGRVLRLPQRDEIDVPVQERLIVELYSK